MIEITNGGKMEIRTNRLYIRNLRVTDWSEMQKIFLDFNNSKYAIYDAKLPVKDKEVKELTNKFVDTNLFFAVYLLDSTNMLGYVCFHKNAEKYDLGYCFHSAYHGKGYAFESATMLMKYLKEQFDAKIFTAGTAIDNIPSCKLLKRLGFECQTTETLSFHKDSSGEDISFQGGNFVYKLDC